MAAVLNGASVTCGCLAPGEIVTVLGTAIGPSPTGLEIGADGKLATTLNGTQLLINGIPVPLLYASTGQLNAIVPHEVATGGNATIQVMSEGQVSGIWEVPMSPAAPATLTLSATGVGQGAINGPSKPAARGYGDSDLRHGGGCHYAARCHWKHHGHGLNEARSPSYGFPSAVSTRWSNMSDRLPTLLPDCCQ